jgi:hypothetical protein
MYRSKVATWEKIMSTTLATSMIAGIALLGAFATWFRSKRFRRADFIRSYRLPLGLYDKMRERRPELSYKDCALVAHALRQFFLAYLKSGQKFVSMPSQVADELWHEFILYTRDYHRFCRHAFGGFLHHTPAVVLGRAEQENEGLRRVWWYACKEENINPSRPSRLPLLFALDSKLKIANGFHYVPKCEPGRRDLGAAGGAGSPYCGGDFVSSSYDGSTTGFGDSGGGFFGEGGMFSGAGASDASGCGGSGCGGGGCGGGGGD